MKSILIAGGSGLIGQRLVELLSPYYELKILSRKKHANTSNVKYFLWNTDTDEIDIEALKSDIIINLSGAGIADKRWTDIRKKELIDSRVKPANLIAEKLKKYNIQPKLYIGASAIGYYGDRADEVLIESSKIGKGFMAECCEAWENASAKVHPFVERFINLRIGIVLSKNGGALPKILMTTPLGLLNYFGDGSMYYSWIHIDDLCKIISDAIEDNHYRGTINAVSPTPLTNKDFVKNLSLSMPSKKLILPAPTFAIKLALGEMSAVVLNSNRVIPQKLIDVKHKFLYEEINADVLKN